MPGGPARTTGPGPSAPGRTPRRPAGCPTTPRAQILPAGAALDAGPTRRQARSVEVTGTVIGGAGLGALSVSAGLQAAGVDHAVLERGTRRPAARRPSRG